MVVVVIETWAYWLLLGALLLSAAATASAAWTKRRESAALKQNEALRDSASRRESWLRKAKREAGYDNSVSFDVVWNETLAKARAPREETPNAGNEPTP